MYVVHVGFSGFPLGNAAVQRVRFTFRAINAAGFTPLAISKQGFQNKNDYTKHVFRNENTAVVITAPIITRPDKFVTRNLNKVRGFINEFFFLYKKRKKIHTAILYSSSFYELVYYRILSKLFNFKYAFQYVEYRSEIAERSGFSKKLNDKLFDRYCQNFSDGVVIISEFLRSHVQKKKPNIPIVKVAAICDFYDIEKIKPANPEYKYMLYCGTLNYIPVIQFVLSFYEKVRQQGIYKDKLVMVVAGGTGKDKEFVENEIKKHPFAMDIVLHMNIHFNVLASLNKSAEYLLIPLRNSVQDVARFPQKISEYVATKRPIISTSVGEVKYYFKNNESAFLADEYDVDNYVEMFKKAQQQGINHNQVGQKGYEVGMKNFHFESNTQNLKEFFNKL